MLDTKTGSNNPTQENFFEPLRLILRELANEYFKSVPPPEPQKPAPLTVEDMVELTGTTKHWVYRHGGSIPGRMKIGRKVYWNRDRVIEWMESYMEG